MRTRREYLKSNQATCLSAWRLTSGLRHGWLTPSGHVLERVVPDFQPDQRLKVNHHDLKFVAWMSGTVVGRLEVNHHDLKLVAWERLFRHPRAGVAIFRRKKA